MNKDLLIWLNPCQFVINKYVWEQIQDFASDKVPIVSGRRQPYIFFQKNSEKPRGSKENLV